MAKVSKSTSELLASIRPDDDDEDDEIEARGPDEEEDEPEGDGADGGDEQDGEGEGDGDQPGDGKAKAGAVQTAKERADEYFARQRGKARDLSLELENERAERQRLQNEMAEMRRRIDAGFAPQPPAAPKDDVNPFDPDDRPVEHARWEAERARKEVEALRAEMATGKEQQTRLDQQQEQERSIAAYAEQVDQDLQGAFGEVPGFGGMFTAYNQAVVRHYVGQGLDQKAATRQATLDHLRIAHNGARQGLTAAQAIYQQASSLGFDLETFQAQPAAPVQPGRQAAAPAPDLDGARAAAARRAPRSINSAPGASGKRSRSIEALASKRDKDWSKQDVSGMFQALRNKAGAW